MIKKISLQLDKMSTHQLIKSEDGSHTIYLPELNETYHSTHGALQESKHVFIKYGLEEVAKKCKEITILEVGFGTGLNALLTIQTAQQLGITIYYHTLEPYPLPEEIITGLNYPSYFNSELQEAFFKIHKAAFEAPVEIINNFHFTKYKTTLQDFNAALQDDVVYFDAFAPNKQPEVWSYSNLQKVYDLLKPGGILVSYCARGQFKRDLKALGMQVEALPGPPGKKEMTRGKKPNTV